MAGYKRKRTIYRLKFEDPEMEGLVVDATGANIEEFMAIAELQDLAEGGVELTTENLTRVADATSRIKILLADHLVAWNLEDDDDVPVPATLAGVKAQEDEFILDIAMAWMDAVGGADAPKEPPSNGGSPSLAASIPMEPLSPNLGTWSEPSLSSAAVSGSGASQAS